jgi:hypothetical protein
LRQIEQVPSSDTRTLMEAMMFVTRTPDWRPCCKLNRS